MELEFDIGILLQINSPTHHKNTSPWCHQSTQNISSCVLIIFGIGMRLCNTIFYSATGYGCKLSSLNPFLVFHLARKCFVQITIIMTSLYLNSTLIYSMFMSEFLLVLLVTQKLTHWTSRKVCVIFGKRHFSTYIGLYSDYYTIRLNFNENMSKPNVKQSLQLTLNSNSFWIFFTLHLE